MSGVFCVLIFALLFAIVLVNTTSTGAKHETRAANPVGKLASDGRCELFLATTSSNDRCDISCWTTTNLTHDVELAIANDTECLFTGYHLRWYEPQVLKLSPGWFKTSAIINKISIRDVLDDPKLAAIEPGAFDDCTFRKMTELVIRRTAIRQLKRYVFEGANSLKKLTLEQNAYLEEIEGQTLDPLYQLEDIVMTQQRRFENLVNFTGDTQLKHLRTLTLSSNNFSSSISADTFKGCTSVETLSLFSSLIQTIGIGSFDPMAETIRFIDLSNNLLKHLPTGLLTNLMRPNEDMDLALSNNLWHCDCDSLELQLWIDNNTNVIADYPLICATPAMEYGKLITDADLSACNLKSPITPITDGPTTDVLDTTTERSTTEAPFLERLNCVNEKYGSGYLYLERVYQYFSIKQVEMGKVSVEISFPDSTLSMVVINDKEEISCRYDLNRQMTFDNLDVKSAHLFCLVQKWSSGTSPKNCYPFHFDDTSSIWGHDEIIIALVCSIVLSLVVGLLCGWLLSCRYQRVFKAKESLQYQSSARSTSKTETSTITSDYVGRPNSKPLRRTYSDNSIVSCKSYITAVTPSSFEIIQWKLRKNAMNVNEFQARDYLDKLEYDCLPPPLPPHPNRRHSEKIYETIGEPVYTCTSDIVPYRITYANQR